MEEAEGAATEVGLDGGGVLVEFQVDLGDGVICWSPNDGWDRLEWKIMHTILSIVVGMVIDYY